LDFLTPGQMSESKSQSRLVKNKASL
jgi:hypothetical protein